MDLRESPEEAAFRTRVRRWLEENLVGEFAALKGRGGPGDEEELPGEPSGARRDVSAEAVPRRMPGVFELRSAWERHLARAGWTCIGWPREHGGAGLTLAEQVIYNEEYARARAPGRLGHIGEELLGPTLIGFGSEALKKRFLPPIQRAEELWCQGYSEPNAGSDLASLKTTAVLDGDEWVVNGQKIWTSGAHRADWCFVLCRTDPEAPRHRGISYLLVPMKQPGVTVRPIRQLTGTAEFNEVFFDGARTARENVVGGVNEGWRVAMGTLAVERGVSTLSQQHGFAAELDAVIDEARRTGKSRDPLIRDRLVRAYIGLKVMRLHALRALGGAPVGEPDRAAMVTKLYWSHWHRDLGELAMDVRGADGLLAVDEGEAQARLQRLFFFTRADTIYAGASEIQRNLIGERGLGLPPEPRAQEKR